MGIITKILAIIYILVGFYLINFQIKLISLAFLKNIEGWILFVGGIIVIISAIRFLMKRTKKTFEGF